MESSCQQAKRTKWGLFEKEGENQRIERESIVERSKLGAKNGKLINKEWLPIENPAVISPYIFSRNVPSSQKTQKNLKNEAFHIKSYFFVWKAKRCLNPMRAKQNKPILCFLRPKGNNRISQLSISLQVPKYPIYESVQKSSLSLNKYMTYFFGKFSVT